ncbi:hypothetical protein CYMTET_34376, partial [Cymbomonas tetramitiformis]
VEQLPRVRMGQFFISGLEQLPSTSTGGVGWPDQDLEGDDAPVIVNSEELASIPSSEVDTNIEAADSEALKVASVAKPASATSWRERAALLRKTRETNG